jgi:1-acyl-sn-glycerol-3-phosphate acyltransferase
MAEIALERSGLIGQLADLLCEWGAGDREALEPLLAEQIARVDDAGLRRFVDRAQHTGSGWGFHPADPLAREISRMVMGRVLQPGSELEGSDHLAVARERPVVFLGNHLSFVDVNVLDALMAAAGYGEVTDTLATLVGPKVFSLPIRRLASLCFGTIKLPQSPSRASDEAVMPPREVARIAREVFRTAADRQLQGDHLLIFPAGSRSRSGAMQRSLAAVSRYCQQPDALILPFGLTGCEKLVPLGEDHVYTARVGVKLGAPIAAATVFERCGKKRQLVVDTLSFLIADVLPSEYRGVYDGNDGELVAARAIATELRH